MNAFLQLPRRKLLATTAMTILGAGALPDDIEAATQGALAGLRPSPRMPVLFLGHGSPMNVIQDSPFRRGWEALGREFGARYPKPQLILCISAHWLTRGWWLTGMAKPRTIHDFGGFPQALFDQQYPAPGAPAVAAGIAGRIRQPAIGLDREEWGLDHGTWSVLKPMFPAADIPVVQLSMDYGRPPGEHLALGRQLKALREQGVLIVGSGNTVHNLRMLRREVPSNQAYDWNVEFDQKVAALITKGDQTGLADFQKLGTVAQMAHPTHEHFLPLLHAVGATDAGEPVRFFNDSYQAASLAMRSVVWG